MKKFATILIALITALSALACAGGEENVKPKDEQKTETVFGGDLASATDVNYGFMHTSGSDDYGRSFTAAEAYNDNVVGIFYFLWLSQAAVDANISEYESKNKAESTLTGDTVASAPTFTWWGEPMYGYYQVEDEWVVRKHVELFINAGLDFICFDSTNNDYYRSAAKTVLDVLLEYSDKGFKVPKAMFMTNSDSTTMTDNIYNAFYRNDKYDDIWFCGNGTKPWIIADYGGTNSAVKNRFYFKAAQWPFGVQYPEKFPWICWKYPQDKFTDSANNYNMMSVSVAQHVGISASPNVNFSLSGLCAPYNYDSLSSDLKSKISKSKATEYYNANWGRGYSHDTKTNDVTRAAQNVNFEEQWEAVYADKSVNMVFITGWNEWIAQKQSGDPVLGATYGHFVDTFNEEFSRDVEMMNGGYADNCFMQMVANIRKYKKKTTATKYAEKSDSATDWHNLDSWKDVPAYCDLTGGTAPRSHAGVGARYYRNDTGRNDISETRVACTDTDIYFLITAAQDITAKAADDTHWMNLFIGVNGGAGGWNGLNYVINRSLKGTAASVDKIQNGAFAATDFTCTTETEGKHMLIKVPKAALGIEGNEFTLNFKVCDNLQKDFDVTELYTNGDCAPIGRINYLYRTK